MRVDEIAGVLTAALALAGLSVVIIYGGQTAQILKAGGESFAGIVKASTLQG